MAIKPRIIFTDTDGIKFWQGKPVIPVVYEDANFLINAYGMEITPSRYKAVLIPDELFDALVLLVEEMKKTEREELVSHPQPESSTNPDNPSLPLVGDDELEL